LSVLTTFVVGLREGLEAALIVGIVAAFLNRSGRRDAIRYVWAGVLLAILACSGIAAGLWLLSSELTQQAQELMETVIGLIAVGMVTYMILWMRKHSRGLKHELEDAVGDALAKGSAFALVGMAVLAVLREGIESVVFLLALFRSSDVPAFAGAGAALGFLVAAGLGYGIYKGGIRLNLARFFKVTGFVLVLVAAGLLMSAAHTAHSAGLLNLGQQQALDLTWLIRPGTILESLLTGVLGLQPKPVVIELVVWLLYLVPLGLYVLWPSGPRKATPTKNTEPAEAAGSYERSSK
jgi:high-affinity iron transporter